MADKTQLALDKINNLFARNKEQQKTYHAPPSFLTAQKNRKSSPGVCIITCSDPRVIPEKYFDFGIGEFFVIRNAGGRAADALRSLAFFDTAFTFSAVLIVHHTDCGMSHVSDADIRAGLKKRVPEQRAGEIDDMAFGEIVDGDFERSLKEDVQLVRGSGWFDEGVVVKGCLFDLESGGVREIVG